MKHYEYEVSQFIDNELPLHEGKEMFAHLSECRECSVFFAEAMKMKKGIARHYRNMNGEMNPPAELIKELYVEKKSAWYYKAGFAASVAAVFVMGYFLYSTQINQTLLENKYNRLITEVSALKGGMKSQASYGSTEPDEKPEAIPVKVSEELKTRQTGKNNYKADKKTDKNKKELKAPARYTFQYASIPAIEIKKEDFLVQQMVGN